ncbi:MAG: hypothetical protein ACREEC_04950 [Thermoplasmata archaeon]
MQGWRVPRWKAQEHDQRSLRIATAYFRPGRLCDWTSKSVAETGRIWSPRATMASAGVR